MLEYGKQRVAEFERTNQQNAYDNKDSEVDAEHVDLGNGHISAEGVSELCQSAKEYCLDIYKENIDTLLSKGDNALLLMRYKKLYSLPYYYVTEPFRVDTYFPKFYLLASANQLHQIEAAVNYLEGEQAQAITALDNELQFSRRVMVGAETIITRVIAIKMAEDTLRTYSQLLELDDNKAAISAVNKISPLTADEYSLLRVLQGELRFQKSILDMIEYEQPDEVGAVLELIYSGAIPLRKNRMLNISRSQMTDYLNMADLPPSRLNKEYLASLAATDDAPSFWEYLFDPAYALYFSQIHHSFTPYIIRHHDFSGLIRLVKLKALLKAEQIPSSEINNFIASSPYASAYTSEMNPIRWDPEKLSLYFISASSDEKQKTISIYADFR